MESVQSRKRRNKKKNGTNGFNLFTDALSYTKAVRLELPLGPVDLGALLRGMVDSSPEFHPVKSQISLDPSLPTVIGNEAA